MPSETTDRITLAHSAASFSSATYWEARYRTGGSSGAGSYGRLADFKAAFVNAFVQLNGVRRVIEFGCGDGNQLSLLSVPHYTGLDVSATILDRCRARFAGPHHAFLDAAVPADRPAADLGLSMDVIAHLTEDPVYEEYLHNLFACSADYVVIYSSDHDAPSPDRHVRHRHVSAYIQRVFRKWRLLVRVPNIYPFDPKRPNDTSLSDFMVFGSGRRECRMLIPALAA